MTQHKWRTEIAVASGVALGQLGAIVQPYLVGTLVDGFHRTAEHAGYIVGTQMACYSIALLVAASFTNRLPLAYVAIAGAALSAISGLFVVAGESDILLYLASSFYGIGQGLAFAAALAAASRASAPERLLGIAATIALIVDGAILAAIPYVATAWGPKSFFFLISGASVVLGLGVMQMDRAIAAETSGQKSHVQRLGTALLVLMLVLFGIGSGAIYAFVERISKAAGIAPQTAGLILMFSLILGGTGSAAAAWLNLKWGRAIPLYVALLVVGFSSLALTLSRGLTSYTIAICIFQVAYTFSFPYMIGASVHLDASGRLAAYSGGIIFLASSAGAAAAGDIVALSSYLTLGTFAFLACAVACVTVQPIVREPVDGALGGRSNLVLD